MSLASALLANAAADGGNPQGLWMLAGNGNDELGASDLTVNGSPITDSPTGIIMAGGTWAERFAGVFDRSGSDALTVELWAKFNWSNNYRAVAVNRYGSNYNWMLYQHTTDGSLQLHGDSQYKTSVIPANDVWMHVAATVDNSGVSKLYLNAVLVATNDAYSYHEDAVGCLGVGGWDNGGGLQENFGGSIAILAVADYTYSADHIAADHALGMVDGPVGSALLLRRRMEAA